MAEGDERNRLAGRVRRYTRVGTAVGSLAARLAGERYLGVAIDRERHAEDLKRALGGLKGPLMKVAQIMSTVPDMLRAGGTLRHGELLAPFGLNAGDPEFWGRGLSVVARLIDELEALS